MRLKSRSIVGIVVLAMLAAVVLAARRFGLHRAAPVLTSGGLTLKVTSGADSGAGSLREAVFAADTAGRAARIVIQVPRISLSSALPPIVNPHGIEIEAANADADSGAAAAGSGTGGQGAAGAAQIDVRGISANTPAFDVDADHVSLTGLSIVGCPGAAILVRAPGFRLSDSSIQACDVGVEIAANATALEVENNRFQNDRIGVRFSAPSTGSELVKNLFTGNTDAGVWLVAGHAQDGADPISVQDNQFKANATGVVLANIPTVIDHNQFSSVQTAAIHVLGAGAIVRNNRISGGTAAGIVAENATGALIEGNELDHLQGYAVLVRGSAGTVLRANRIESCAYGVAFVLGDQHQPNMAVDNVMIDLKYDGIDVIGDSPVLRRNQVLQARVAALHTENFTAANGQVVRAQPLLESNTFRISSPAAASAAARH